MKLQRRITKEVMGMSAWVSVISAVFLASGAFLGGLATAQYTARNQSAENLKEFRRDQPQLDRYAAVLKQAIALRALGPFSPQEAFNPESPNRIYYDVVIRPAGIPSQESFGTPTVTGGVPTAPQSSQPAQPQPSPAPSPPPPKIKGNTVENVRGPWQTAYNTLDQAVSEAELVASADAIKFGRAMLDRYRLDYRQSILDQIGLVRALLNNNYDQSNDQLADTLVGVPGHGTPPELLRETTTELTQRYQDAAREDLGVG